jgi:hypothetical protein
MSSILSATDAKYTQFNGNLKILLRFLANLKIKNIGLEQVQANVLRFFVRILGSARSHNYVFELLTYMVTITCSVEWLYREREKFEQHMAIFPL